MRMSFYNISFLYMYMYHQEGLYTSSWINSVMRILNESGIGNTWYMAKPDVSKQIMVIQIY